MVAASLVFPAASLAQAGGTEVHIDGDTIEYASAPGQDNLTNIHPETEMYNMPGVYSQDVANALYDLPVALQVHEWRYRITAGTGCVQTFLSPFDYLKVPDDPTWVAGEHKATCPYDSSVTEVVVRPGDGNDEVFAPVMYQRVLIDAGPGDDVIEGGQFGDIMAGGDGDDEAYLFQGPDLLSGGIGNDTAHLGGGGGHADLEGDPDDGLPGQDAQINTDFENLWGSYWDDQLFGDDAANTVTGDDGDDYIEGGGGEDVLSGSYGDDEIRSRDGVQDQVYCGVGVDVAVVDAEDVVASTCEQVLRPEPRPANDNFAGAQDLGSGLTASVSGSNVGATKEAGEPAHAGDEGGASVWYRWTAPTTQEMSVDTCGSGFDTLLAVYTGPSVGSLQEVASNDDTCALSSRATFVATAGTAYWIAVDGWKGTEEWHPDAEEGAFQLELGPAAAAPGNDNFADAEHLGAGSSVTGDTFAATKEDGEPDHAGDVGGASIWYAWEAPFGGDFTIDLCDSDFDTLLAVYSSSGAGFASLTEVASNDQACGEFGDQSEVTFTADAGATYWIAVDGWSNGGAAPPSRGRVHLEVTPEEVPPDTPPTAVNDGASVNEDASATAIDVLANDTDPDGGPKQIQSATDPAHGTIAVTGGGSGLTYRPDPDYCNYPPLPENPPEANQPDRFTYTLNGGSTATVGVTVFCVDDGDVTPPDVSSVSPVPGETSVPVDAGIAVTFSEPMRKDTAEEAFSLRDQSNGGLVSGSFSWNGNMMIFDPNGLGFDRAYTARVSTDAEDLAGNALLVETIWSFTTELPTPQPASAPGPAAPPTANPAPAAPAPKKAKRKKKRKKRRK